MTIPRWLAATALSLAVLAAGPPARAAELPRATPQSVGLSPERLALIGDRLKADVEAHVIPGAVLLVARHGRIAYEASFGRRDPAMDGSMAADAIFRIYSMSKPITSVAAMMLVEDGRLSLDEPVSKYIPAFAHQNVAVAKEGGGFDLVPARRPPTVQDLLRHTSGLTYGFFGDLPAKRAYLEAGLLRGDFDLKAFTDRIAALPLAFQPGTTWDYSHSTDVLGRIVEVVSGQSLFAFEKARILDPLGMADTSFTVPEPARQARIAEPFADDRAFGTEAAFNDSRQPSRFESGGGGMVSTAGDYARFLEMLRAGGTLDGRRILSPATVAYMTADQIGPGSGVAPGPFYLPGPGYGFGLGFQVRRDAGIAPVPGSVGEYSWGGVGGTAFWVDPKRDLFVVFMMQSPRARLAYRAILRDMVYAAIADGAPRAEEDAAAHP